MFFYEALLFLRVLVIHKMQVNSYCHLLSKKTNIKQQTINTDTEVLWSETIRLCNKSNIS